MLVGPALVSVNFAGAVIDSDQAAFALTLALPPDCAYVASGSTLPKSTVGVSSDSWTDARFVNFTVWFCWSLLGGGGPAETADTAVSAATRAPTSAMRVRDMHFLLRGICDRRH